jgi:hypothetical protein
MARIRVKESLPEDETAIDEQANNLQNDSSTESNEPVTQKRHLISRSRLLAGFGVFIILILGLYAYALIHERDDLKQKIVDLQKDPAILARQQQQELMNKIGDLIELPKNETPTIADVTDVEQARKQDQFYQDAQNGDKVLFYVKAGKAILYRPSTKKVITTAPINQNAQP